MSICPDWSGCPYKEREQTRRTGPTGHADTPCAPKGARDGRCLPRPPGAGRQAPPGYGVMSRRGVARVGPAMPPEATEQHLHVADRLALRPKEAAKAAFPGPRVIQ